MNRLEGPVKQFISYNVTVQNSCGQSVCVSYDQSVAGALGMLNGPTGRFGLEWQYMYPFREDPIRDSDLRYDERKKFWRTPTPSLEGWPEGVVNSLCIVDLRKVFRECKEEGLRRFEDGARPVQIVATGAFMAPNQGRDISRERQNWANATDYLTYTTYALIRKPPRKLKPVEIAAIAVGALAAFSAAAAEHRQGHLLRVHGHPELHGHARPLPGGVRGGDAVAPQPAAANAAGARGRGAPVRGGRVHPGLRL